MLIEFSVTNFRSIREKQTLSLVASGAAKELPECLIERNLPGLSGLRFLKGAAIYGANASGKSNIIKAMRFLAEFVKNSATWGRPGDSIGTEPFRLDQDSPSSPSRFEVAFLTGGIRFSFGCSLTTNRVTEEYIVAYPKGAPQHWYHRSYNESAGSYDWARPSASFRHDQALRDRTRENCLFLSVAPQFNHPQLTQPFSWFRDCLRLIGGDLPFGLLGDDYGSSLTTRTARLLTQPSHHERIIGLLRSADVGIIGGKADERELETPNFLSYFSSPEFLGKYGASDTIPSDRKTLDVALLHRSLGNEEVAFDFESEESAGTQRLFALIGPWIDALDQGLTIFVDEIEASLHPAIVRGILSLIFSAEHNPKGAQVIFTTHSPVLLDNTLMRRDQIWFTEKAPTGATRLYPLTDYQPRKDEALAKGYLAGRYGAIPFLPDGLKL